MTDTTSFDYTPYNHVGRIHTYLAARPKEATELMSKILEKTVAEQLPEYQSKDGEYRSTADLGYCKVVFDAKAEVSSNINKYCVIGKHGVNVFWCDDLAHVVETILRKWW